MWKGFIKIGVTAILLMTVSMSNAHPFHVSVAQMKYNAQNRTLEIAIKLFTDDLEDALTTSFGNQGWHLATPRQLPAADKYVRNYLKPRFAIKQNNRTLSWNWIGAEYNMDAVWCYIEMYDFDHEADLEWKNIIFFEIFNDQKNIGHFDILDHDFSAYTTRKKRKQIIGYNK